MYFGVIGMGDASKRRSRRRKNASHPQSGVLALFQRPEKGKAPLVLNLLGSRMKDRNKCPRRYFGRC